MMVSELNEWSTFRVRGSSTSTIDTAFSISRSLERPQPWLRTTTEAQYEITIVEHQ